MVAILFSTGVIMQDFVYLFELFTILMGLAVAVMLRGFAGVLKLRARRRAGVDKLLEDVRVGWLVPLLGIFVLVDLTTFWLFMYEARNSLPFNYVSILAIVLIIGAYYMVASLIFPDEPELWNDFDDYYWELKRFIILGIFIINIISAIGLIFIGPASNMTPEYIEKYPIVVWCALLLFLGMPWMLWAALSNNRKVNIIFFIYYISVHLFYGYATAVIPPYAEGMAL